MQQLVHLPWCAGAEEIARLGFGPQDLWVPLLSSSRWNVSWPRCILLCLTLLVVKRPLFAHKHVGSEISKVDCYKKKSRLLELSHYCH